MRETLILTSTVLLAAFGAARASSNSTSASGACVMFDGLVSTAIGDCGVNTTSHACTTSSCDSCVCARVNSFVAGGCANSTALVGEIVTAVGDACAAAYPDAAVPTGGNSASNSSSGASAAGAGSSAAAPTPTGGAAQTETSAASAAPPTATAAASYSRNCGGVADNLVVCTSRTQFSICFKGEAIGSLDCAAGTVCCGAGGVKSCVFETDALCAANNTSTATTPALTPLPAGITIPADSVLIANLQGVGTQNYVCNGSAYEQESVTAALFAEAAAYDNTIRVLYDFTAAGQPRWTAADGSEFIGTPVVKVPAADPAHDVANVLLQRANGTTSPAGVLQPAVHLVRVNTHGGVAPSSCSEKGRVLNVDYYAEYYFYT